MPRPTRPRRAGRRGLACALLAPLLIAGAPVWGAPAAAHSAQSPKTTTVSVAKTESTKTQSTKTQSADAAEEEPQAELVVSPASPVLEEAEENHVFNVLIRNPGKDPLPGGTVELEVDRERVSDATELDAFPETGMSLASATVDETAGESEQSLTVSVPRAEFPLELASPAGVYRVRATIFPDDPDAQGAEEQNEQDPEGDPSAEDADSASTAPADDALQAVTPIVWRGTEGNAQVRVTAIVPFVLPEEVRSMPTRGQLDEAAPRLDALLSAAEDQRATLAIDPRLVAGIRAYGEAAPEAARDLLQRLETSGLPQFLLQFADADPAAQAALGYEELLQPADLSFLTRFGTFPEPGDEAAADQADADPGADNSGEANGGETGPDAEATAEDGAAQRGDEGAEQADADPEPQSGPVAPTLEELLSWPADRGVAWPAAGEADSATLELLQRSGLGSAVLSSSNVNHSGGPRIRLGEIEALVADAELASSVRDSLTAEQAAEQAAGTARASALLALAAERESPGTVLALDRGAVADAEDPALLLTQLSDLNWVNTVGEGAQESGTGSLRAGSTLEDRRELLRTAAGRESTVTDLAPLLTRPEYLNGYQRARVMELFATRYAAPDIDFADVAERFQNRDSELLEGVHVISTEHTQLVGTSSRVPVQLHNSLPFDAAVTGSVMPSSAGLTVQEREIAETIVPARGNESVLVPVRSRVSSGDSGLVVSLTDVTGERTFFTGSLPIVIRSSVESIALWSLGGAALLLLGFGTWRSVRRRAKRVTPDETDSP